MMRLLGVVMVIWAGLARGVLAQSSDGIVWVQIEAQPTLAAAAERAAEYAADLPDVNGFSLGNGWYGIALGPYAPQDAEQVLRVYRSEGSIPRDSYIAFSSSFASQFWPVGTDLLKRGVLQVPQAPDATAEAATPTPEPQPEIATPEPADETPAQARRSESLLSETERKDLQIALQWAGFYDSAIDGAFGRGTRGSMAAWQDANGFERTGVLTTLQRELLLKNYNAVLDGLGLELTRDAKAGLELKLPLGVVTFDRYEPPFAHYKASGDLDARVLLISQPGDRDTLAGLYDIMQTLEIVPLEGPRDRKADSFVLIGENGHIVSETRASLENGRIKGFTLVWPSGDEDRRRRLVAEMDKSLVRLDSVLDPAAGMNADQAIDLVSGLQIRQPRVTRSGFFVDARGAVVTTAEAVQSCNRITLDEDHEATVTAADASSGVAILTPKKTLSPPAVARFSAVPPRLQSEVAIAGYPYGGVLTAPSMTFGTLADLRGLQGEETLNRLTLAPQPGDAGGPVIDAGGNVLGMLLPRTSGGPQLPADVSFALAGGAIAEVMARAGLTASSGTDTAALDPQDITTRGVGMTVLVSCWD